MENQTFNFTAHDDLTLLGRVWPATTDEPKGIVLLVHGLGEHSGRYAHVAKALNTAGYHLVAFDLRGHGLSEGPRGHTPSYTTLLDDVDIFLAQARQDFPESLPRFLYGHSLGGNIVLNFGLRREADLAGYLVTSPLLETAFKPSEGKLFLAKIFSRLMPTFTLKNGLATDALSRDAAVVKAYQDDVYVHDLLSARLGHEMLEAGQYALDHAAEWQSPLLLMHGTEDQITSHQASRQFAETAGDSARLVLWEGYYHEMHNDLGQEQVIETMIDWLNQVAG